MSEEDLKKLVDKEIEAFFMRAFFRLLAKALASGIGKELTLAFLRECLKEAQEKQKFQEKQTSHE